MSDGDRSVDDLLDDDYERSETERKETRRNDDERSETKKNGERSEIERSETKKNDDERSERERSEKERIEREPPRDDDYYDYDKVERVKEKDIDIFSNSSNTSMMLKRLSSFLHQYNYIMTATYSRQDSSRFIRITNKSIGYQYILVIPSKYDIERLSDSIVLHHIDKPSSNSENKVYEKITEFDLIDENKYLDPKEIDKLMSYESIDINKDYNINIYEESETIKDQLKRLRNCVEDLKYKVCIESNNCFCIIDKDNDITCYSYDMKREKFNYNSVTKAEKKLYITIELDTFYNHINNVLRDTELLEKNLYSILNKTHTSQVTIIKNYLRKFINIGDMLEVKYSSKDKYMGKIKSIREKIMKIDTKEKELEKELKIINPSTRIPNETTVLKSKKLEADIEELQVMKKEAINILVNLKNSYDNFMLEFETILVDNIELLGKVSSNFEKIGLIKQRVKE